jgi:UDP-2,3-diacylglucosamine pyrophosphatase LpxH
VQSTERRVRVEGTERANGKRIPQSTSMTTDFSHALHTLIVSDIHLADAEQAHPGNPLWKRFKRRKHFVDASFKAFLEYMQGQIEGRAELILNGDIFDFDSVMALPTAEEQAGWPDQRISWLEKRRGLAAEEQKSRFKMKVILNDHSVFLDALRSFVLKGHRLVFVIGNHDMELQWPSVRQDVVDRMDLPEVFRDHVRFCEWFYISNQDTLVEHGNQYDPYCLSANPINPLIKKGKHAYVRIPFGNLAGKYMVNGMGLFNPHADSSYIKSSFKDYLKFYFKYIMRVQPFLLVTWFWSAIVTLLYSVSEGLLPAMSDPITLNSRVEDIAQRANATSSMVWSLKELHAHPAIFNPIKILRELWLDRALLLGLVFFLSFNFFSYLRVFIGASFWWFVVAVLVLMPAFLFYARSVESDVSKTLRQAFVLAPQSARITHVQRVIQGHVHLARHTHHEGIEYLNTGTWSPAYRDVECTQPYGKKCFAWLRPRALPSESDTSAKAGNRLAELYEWKDDDSAVLLPVDGDPIGVGQSSIMEAQGS